MFLRIVFDLCGCVQVIKKRIGKKAVEGAKPILEKGLQNDRIDLRQSLSDPSMDSGSSLRHSEEPGERQIVNQKQSKTMTGEDLDGNVTWTDESVKFLLDTYAAVHQRLGEQSNGQVKYQKKWMSILWAMQQRFGKHFTKKQCQSKYWCVRRECTDYWYVNFLICMLAAICMSYPDSDTVASFGLSNWLGFVLSFGRECK